MISIGTLFVKKLVKKFMLDISIISFKIDVRQILVILKLALINMVKLCVHDHAILERAHTHLLVFMQISFITTTTKAKESKKCPNFCIND
jgi:hypothetical protein